MLIDLNSASSQTTFDQSSLNTNNLNSLIGGSIRILNSTDYSKQLNNQSNSSNRQSCLYLNSNKTYNNNNSISMKNINEIQPRSKNDYTNNNYNNLQLALKAATAALQKSKITASSNLIPNSSYPFPSSSNSSHNLNQQIYISQQKIDPIRHNYSKSNLNLNKNSSNSNSTKSSKSPSSSSTSSTSSTQALSGSAASVLFNSNQSLFQPYSKLKEKKLQPQPVQRSANSSTPISVQKSNMKPKSKLYRNTIVIDAVQLGSNSKLNNLSINNNQTTNSTSSALSTSSTRSSNIDKFDSSDYDNIEQIESSNSHLSLNSNSAKCLNKKSIQTNHNQLPITIKINNNLNKSTLKRQKSASTEFLNLGNSKKDLDMDDDSLNNYNHIKDFESILNTLDKDINSSVSNLKSNSPQPPRIQPLSGVLSKSLFSIVLKPRPVKPVIDPLTQKPSIKVNDIKVSKGSNTSFLNKSLLKKKCVSTTNLVFETSLKGNIYSENKAENFNANSSKSVTTLNSINNNNNKAEFISSSDNSINIDEVDVDDDEDLLDSNDQLVDVIISDKSNNNEKRILDLENQLRLKSNEIIELKNRLSIEIGKNKTNKSHRNLSIDELEEEKQIYEQKLNSIKAHFNQQLNLYEQNDRIQMQEKLNSLQKIYNDLKSSYRKNLDNELRNLRTKLNESEAYAEQLYKQLQILQLSTSRNKSGVSIGTQANLFNERDLNNNNNNNNSNEMLYYIKKIKSENNELRLQLESERRRYQGEKEKWYLQFQTNIENKRNSINMSNDNLNNQSKIISNLKNQNILLNQLNLNKQNPLSMNNNSIVKVNSNQTSTISNKLNQNQTKQPYVKNVLLNQQHYL